MKIYLVRHGETELNRKHCYYGSLDPVLTEQGREQAILLGRYFCRKKIDRVYTSTLRRSSETADLILGERNMLRTESCLLDEQNFGMIEGMTYTDIMERYPEVMEAWNVDYSHYRLPEGESFEDVRNRVDRFVRDELLPASRSESRKKQMILIAAHKGTMGHMMASLLGLPVEGYWNFVFEQGCYSEIDLEDGYAIIRKLNQSVDK